MIEALETRYDGIIFRSRTEAKWALWLTHMKIKWMYEVEAFRVDRRLAYLPDFWLADLGLWLEIKPPHDLIPWHDHEKMSAFAAALPFDPRFRVLTEAPWQRRGLPAYGVWQYDAQGTLQPTREAWRQCRWCRQVRLVAPGVPCPRCWRWWWRARFTTRTTGLLRAFAKARAERFGT